MTIWRTLLVSFLVIGLLPTTGLTLLAFGKARKSLKAEIARNVLVEASAVMEQIDESLFERLENVRTWTKLHVMQELRVGDVDKQVSHILADLKAGNSVYTQIFCTATDGRIVATSDPSHLGQHNPQQAPWLTAALPQGTILLEPLSVVDPRPHLNIRAAIPDSFQEENTIGTLYASFDWEEVFRKLDHAEQHSPLQGTQRMAVLLDGEGRIIAASSLLRQRGVLLSPVLAFWPPAQAARHARQGNMTVDGQLLGAGKVLVGYAPSHGNQGFRGFGWSVLVIQSTQEAFAPIEQMRFSFLVLLSLTVVMAVAGSLLIASKIAHPIRQLAEFSRRFARQGKALELPPVRQGEIGELTHAFGQMTQDLERSREDLIRAAKLAVVGEMAAIMAHEVRTPLGILSSSAEMLQRESHLSPEGHEMASFVVSETDRLNRLVSTLLECARPRPPIFQDQDVHTVIQRAVDLLAQRAARRRIAIVTELYASPSTLPCDGEQLVQVFLNLLLNALQMLSEGGQIHVRTMTEGSQCIIEVADNGPGIPPQDQPRVFDPFFTTREDGMGLGLTVVQQIVQLHGGDITIRNSLSGGATFRCVFPLTAERITL